MIITQTPLRISFVGGGTDLPDFYSEFGGAVISTAIDKYVFVIVKERFDEMIYLNWMKKEIVKNPSEIEHELIREAMRKTGVTKGVEITTLADIPAEGSGLGSSSSLTVCLLHALYLHTGKLISVETLAREACEIEIDVLGKPQGVQDQYIAAYGGLKHFEFKKDKSVVVTTPKVNEQLISNLGMMLMLFFTGKTRKSSDVNLKQKKNIPNTVKVLEEMRNQTFQVLKELEKGNLKFLGDALDLGWELKKKLADGVSNPEIDKMYQKAKKAGAIGGKIAGAGGGGFLLLFVPLEKQFKVRKALSNYRELKFNLERDGTKAIFNIRR
jgi:D-glycero-alpha-D-manno-heptose-7-phosphate kinase